jgi:DNA polymerase III delta prime subunit
MSNNTEFLWVEKYRPQTIDDCILPPDLKKTLNALVKGGQLPNLLFTGTAGLGKTTVAKALCNMLNLDYILINGSEESGIDVLRNKIKQFASTVSLSGGYKVVILDEADYLNCFDGTQLIQFSTSDSDVDIKIDTINNLLGTEFFARSVNPVTLEECLTPAYVIEKGEAEVFEVKFDDGSVMKCTEDHVFFDENGNECKIKDMLKMLSV